MSETSAYVQQNSVTADGALVTVPCRVYGFYVTGDGGGVNAARVIFYDNATVASGTVLCELRCESNKTSYIEIPASLVAVNGVFADITTVGRAGVFYQG